MSLERLTAEVAEETVGDVASVKVSDLVYDSRRVTEGALFFCVPGHLADGHDFAGEAVERGAAALVCERKLDLDVPQVVVGDARTAMAQVAARFFEEPTRSLLVVGVTGTNGKTTTTHLLRAELEACGLGCGLLGTVDQIVGGRRESVELTTPEAVDLQRTFRRMLDAGDEACVMEVSSHALELGRCGWIHFNCALFTNLSQDHLDFHGTMEQYYSSKRGLFFPSIGPVPEASVVNADDRHGGRLISELEQAGRSATTFGIDSRDVDYRAVEIDGGPQGIRFKLDGLEGRPTVETKLHGLFNAYNALGTIAAIDLLGLDIDKSLKALREAEQVPGRFEPVDIGQGFKVLVDYAHTPDSLENVLCEARAVTSKRLLAVFGCGGDRDRGKRPLMGEIACRLADLVYVTSDNPRNEKPEDIVEEIMKGARGARGYGEDKVVSEVDRRRAIALALVEASAGDTVVIAGKGHETGQEFEKGRKVEFDDRKVAEEELRRLKETA